MLLKNMTVSLGMMTFNVDSKPRHLVFSKIERLISFMNDQKTGIQLRDKKNFLTTVHSSFTGAELISWLSDNVCEDDREQALHLATFMCMYGYIYPIDIKSFMVKDEKSVRYKFQSPYYWPSKNLKLTNEKYIIYLLKRSKRNKQKHGLEEHEQSALNKLQIVFSDKMGFVRSQADEQVRQVKMMKRDDKLSHDLQERAFWRVYRPPPNQVKYLEDGPSRCFQPSQMSTRKKKNRDLKLIEVDYLRKAVARPRMKFSKSIEIFLQYDSQYKEYDAFLDPLAAQPSNPWLSDDETMWEINKPLVEIPTVMRIKRWALSFEELLSDKSGWNEFEHFLKKEYSQENILFYKACRELTTCPQSLVKTWVTDIESKFLTPGASCEVNVDCKTMEKITLNLKSGKDVNMRYIFHPAMEHVFALMKKDSYSRFLRSEQYKNLMHTAQNHYTKKRFFSFGSNRKKTPSPQPRRRGSASSDNALGGDSGEIGGHSYHSYSTGNLRDLDEKPKRAFSWTDVQSVPSCPVSVKHRGSDSSIYVGIYEGQSNSPSLRRKVDDAVDKQAVKDARRRSNLDVPRTGMALVSTDPTRKSESLSPCLALNVPRTNVVTPWEGQS